MSYIAHNHGETVGGGTIAYRKSLVSVVMAILQESGFQCIEKVALGTLVEMLQSFIYELGHSSKGYCEVANRAEPVIADIILALCEAYGKSNSSKLCVPNPGVQIEVKSHNVLQVGDKKTHPSHIPEYFPLFPDTHTYLFSHTHKQPVTEYEAIREKAASQKKDIERALTKFSVKTSETESLFLTEDKEFLLIKVKTASKPFIDALMPRDQVFEEAPEYKKTRKRKSRKVASEENPEEEREKPDVQDQEMNNPYLCPVKMPKKAKPKKVN